MAGDNWVGFAPIAGKTSQSTTIRLISSAGADVTGKLATNLTAYYYRQGAAATVSISLSDLAALNTAYTSGGVKEIGNGLYRLDLPDTMLAAGVDWVDLVVTCAGAITYAERFTLSDAIPGAAAGASGGVPVIGTGTNNFKSDSSANVTAADTLKLNGATPNNLAATSIVSGGAITTSGGAVVTVTNVTNDVGITQAGADKVWVSAARTLTAFGFTVSITLSAANILAIWNQLDSDGGIIANSFGAAINAIKAQTDKLQFSASNFVKGILLRWLTDDSAGTPNPLVSNNVPVGTVTVGDVTLAASQPNYAPAKAGAEMNLADDAITTAKVATGVVVGTSPTAGQYTLVLTINDANTGLPIPNVFVIIKGTNDTTAYDQNTTNPNGQATFALNANDYLVHLALPPAYQSAVESLTVAGNTAQTYTLTPIVIGSPTDPSQCRVYGFEYTGANPIPVVGRQVKAQLASAANTDDVILETVQYNTVTDVNGEWYFDLVIGKTYTIVISAASINKTIVVPDAPNVNLATL